MILNDFEIVSLYHARNEQAVEITQKQYGTYCHTVSMNILNSQPDAEECVNDTYLRTWNSIPPARPASLKLFLARITRNISLNRHRALHADKRNRDLEVSLSELETCFPAPDDLPEGSATPIIDAMNDFLAAQSKTDRMIFVQRYWYSLPASQIAEELGMTENAVWVRLHRTREKLREHLTERGYKL